MTIADRIKLRRKTLSMTQTALAKAAGMSQQMVGKLETGESTETARLVQLAAALGVTAEWLATGSLYPVSGGEYTINLDGSLSRVDVAAPSMPGTPDTAEESLARELLALSSPRSALALESIISAARAGTLSEADIELLGQIAARLQHRGK